MTRAGVAILKSAVDALAARHHLDHDEMVRAALDIALHHSDRAAIDLKMLHALVDDLHAQAARRRGAAHEQ